MNGLRKKIGWGVATAVIIAAVFGCLKPGDGVGLDQNGQILPPKPVDSCLLPVKPPRCTVAVDSCLLPNKPPRCTDPCLVNPNAPPCSTYCKANPLAMGCPAPPNFYRGRIQPIFSNYCVTCHNPNGVAYPQTQLDLSTATAHANLVNVQSKELVDNGLPPMLRVKPGNADSSYLYLKVSQETPAFGGRMPLGLTPLTPAQINDIKFWIVGGAPSQ